MYSINQEIITSTQESDHGTFRRSNIGYGIGVKEYQANDSDYRSIEVDAHGVDFASIKTTNRTITLGSQEKVKIRTISFKDSDGVNQEIHLFSERF
jgi:hypothetical protein